MTVRPRRLALTIATLALLALPTSAQAAASPAQRLVSAYAPITMLREEQDPPCETSAEQYEPTTVSTVSIATVAAFVIPQGLGRPIFIALNQDIFKTEILAAGLLVIGLALFADLLLVLAQRLLTPWARAT